MVGNEPTSRTSSRSAATAGGTEGATNSSVLSAATFTDANPKGSLTERFTEWLQELLYRILLRGSTLPGGWLTIVVLLIVAATAHAAGPRVVAKSYGTPGTVTRVDSGALVVKRSAPAIVCRWMKVAFSGGAINLSPCWAVTSTK